MACGALPRARPAGRLRPGQPLPFSPEGAARPSLPGHDRADGQARPLHRRGHPRCRGGPAFRLPDLFGHGFVTLSDSAEVQYKCTGLYTPPSEGTVAWNDPDIAIEWPFDD